MKKMKKMKKIKKKKRKKKTLSASFINDLLLKYRPR